RVRAAQVEDELLEVRDRVDVVVRRRRDEPDAGRRVADERDVVVDLVAGKLAASPGLAPWAILICSSSELTRYSIVTPKRPEATCLMALRRQSPLASRG